MEANTPEYAAGMKLHQELVGNEEQLLELQADQLLEADDARAKKIAELQKKVDATKALPLYKDFLEYEAAHGGIGSPEEAKAAESAPMGAAGEKHETSPYLSEDDIREFVASNLYAMRQELMQYTFQVVGNPECMDGEVGKDGKQKQFLPPHAPIPRDPQSKKPLPEGQYNVCSRCHWTKRVAQQRAAIKAVESYDFRNEPGLLASETAPAS